MDSSGQSKPYSQMLVTVASQTSQYKIFHIHFLLLSVFDIFSWTDKKRRYLNIFLVINDAITFLMSQSWN